MTAVDACGALALLLLLLVFYFVRRVPVYVASGAAITLGFAAATFGTVNLATVSNWVVMTLGLGACTFGLLIVRVMLIRSVSLNMLRGIEGGAADVFGENIETRPDEMQRIGLVARAPSGENALTGFGRFAAGIVATAYAIFRIKS
jgi:energy-coupling factor transporter transmembrane protein EcfT